MKGSEVKAYLGIIGERMDEGRPLEPLRKVMVRSFLKPLAVPAAIGLSLALGMGAAGCNEEETNCSDGVDNDDDGDIDCYDTDCYDTVACNTADAYGAPFLETECDDELDNDDDGLVDCDDPDCADDGFCVADLYGAPFM